MPDDGDRAARHFRHEPNHPDAVVAGRNRQQRHQRDAEPGSDQALEGAVVVGAKSVVDLVASLVQLVLDDEAARAGVRPDQHVLPEVVERRGLPRGERAVGGDDEDVRVAHHLDRLEGAVRKRGAAEGEVELARLDRAIELWVGPGLGEPELDAGPVPQEPLHHARQHAGSDRLIRPDAQHPGLARIERGDVGARGVEPGHDRLGMAQEQLAGLGERDGARAARALDQRLPDELLERRDLLAHGRLRIAQPVGGAPEGALACDRVERGEVPHLDAEPLIRLRNGTHEMLDLT